MTMVEWYWGRRTEVRVQVHKYKYVTVRRVTLPYANPRATRYKAANGVFCDAADTLYHCTKAFFTFKLTHVPKVPVWTCSLLTHTTKVRPSLRRFSLHLHKLNPITCGSPTGLPNSTHMSETKRGRQDRNYFTALRKSGRYLSLQRYSWNSPLLNRIGQIYDTCIMQIYDTCIMSLTSFKSNAKCGLKFVDAH